MVQEQISELICAELPFSPTEEQSEAIARLSAFVADPRTERCFALRGFAGTGKTSLIGALVRMLRKVEIPVILLAPTGRAAKVFAHHAGGPAHTIHRVIYRQETFKGQDTPFQLGFNTLKHAIFIVDEASMIASGSALSDTLFGSGMLLDDLIRFIYENPGNKLLLVGDTAQLPPVGEEESPALQRDTLCGYGLLVSGMLLTQVVRQDQQSMVLQNATYLRTLIEEQNLQKPQIHFGGELINLPGNELIEALYDAYHEFGPSDTVVVTRSNKRANVYNNGIRARIFDREEELCRGDLVMVVKNNYHWVKDNLDAEGSAPQSKSHNALCFLANGDVAEVVRLRNQHEQYGFRFADATLRFIDYDEQEIDCRVMLSTLQSESPSLTHDEQHQLYEAVMEDYAHLPSQKERFKALREDPYYNAVQIKYAYAVTCHKAQGGQWARVFVDQGYVTDDMIDISYLRWLYTALTRTTDRLYLVNWPKEQVAEADN